MAMTEADPNGAPAIGEEEDLSGDRGVLRRIIRPGTGDVPPAMGDSSGAAGRAASAEAVGGFPSSGGAVRVRIHYIGMRLSGDVFDTSRNRRSGAEAEGAEGVGGGAGDAPHAFLLGRGHVIKGWDCAVARMRVGEAAQLTIRADYAYGVAGRPPTIPPHATLVYTLELVDFEVVADAVAEAEDSARRLALPERASEESGGAADSGVKVIEVDGAPVKVDKLGPVVVNTDGSLCRITNWDNMTEREQQLTLRSIGRRNQQRLAALRAAGGESAVLAVSAAAESGPGAA